jgi:hypothetical protein
MNRWIADFFDSGHTLYEIYNMSYHEYIEIANNIAFNRSKESGKGISRDLRPVQKEALKNKKQMDNKK